MSNIPSLNLSGIEALPIIEGGKGIGVTNGVTAGSFAAKGAVGTFSGVNADYVNENGEIVPVVYRGKTRGEKHEELLAYSIEGGVSQAKIAHQVSGGKGRIHINILWEMASAEHILTNILEQSKGLIHGVTCGAGMPYRLAEIAARFSIYYYPIVSSCRAFRALWQRSYRKMPDLLGGVVYEDPWKAGGHNGLSNSEDPKIFQDPYPRVREIRSFMNEVGLEHVPIVMAGGVWQIDDYSHWLNNPEIGLIAFQFGTRPIVTKEYPVADSWKKKLMILQEGEVYLNRFSPTGFYSSAVENSFIRELQGREERQVEYRTVQDEEFSATYLFGPRKRPIYLRRDDKIRAEGWEAVGFNEPMKTPDSTLMFVTKKKADDILRDQIDCMGCLSACRFSNYSTNEEGTTGKKADPRSFCIQKTLQAVAHYDDMDHQLMFSGHNAYRFATDPFYKDGFVPTIGELVDRLMIGK